jgi:hypothetical protein
MTINVIFDNVKVYDVQSRLDVVVGTVFSIEILDQPTPLEVYTNNDPVLTIDQNLEVSAATVGESKIRFMDGFQVVKDLHIVVAPSVGSEAVALGLTFGAPVPK